MTGGTRRLRRSLLYVPADRPELVPKALATDADAVVVDLEDAVRPAEKADARAGLTEALAGHDRGGIELFVRVNDRSTEWWADDLRAAVEAGADAIHLPKVESAEGVRALDDRLDALGAADVEAVAILETPTGVFDGRAIAAAIAESSAVTGLSFGAADYARAVGGSPDAGSIRSFLAHRVVGLAAIAGVHPIASAYTDIPDLGGLREAAEAAREIGFVGQSTIHPDQVPVVNEVFTPTEVEVERARELLDAFESGAGGAARVGGVVLDEATIGRFRRRIRRYEAVHGADEG